MSTSDVSPEIKKLREILEKEKTSKDNLKCPREALNALDDEKVRNAIQAHFDNGEVLLRVRALGTFFPTGHDHICFDFSHSDKIRIYKESIVVIVNDESKVIGYEDHFKTDITTKVLSRPQRRARRESDIMSGKPQGEMPFVLDRPSINGRVLDPEQVQRRTERSNAYITGRGITPITMPRSPYTSSVSGTSFETTSSCDAWTDEPVFSSDTVMDSYWDPADDDPWPNPVWVFSPDDL